jgi:hypothetical protein
MSDGEISLFMLDNKCCIDCGNNEGVEFFESHPSAIFCKRCHSIYYVYSENGPNIVRYSKFKREIFNGELYKDTTFEVFINRLLQGELNELPM